MQAPTSTHIFAVDVDWSVRSIAQGNVQYSTVFSKVDLLPSKHGISHGLHMPISCLPASQIKTDSKLNSGKKCCVQATES